MQLVQSGVPLLVEYGAYDMQTGLYFQMRVYEVSASMVKTLVDTLNLVHLETGGYGAMATFLPNKNYYTRIVSYTAPDYLVPNSDYSPSSQSFYAMDLVGLFSTGTVYGNKMSTVYNSLSTNQEIIAWAEKSGQRVLAGSNCVVTVKDSSGGVAWTDSLPTPNADGLFKFINTFTPVTNSNYYVIISITVDAVVRTSIQTFFTVG